MTSISGSRFAACPICGKEFHQKLLPRHAARCGILPISAVSSKSARTTPGPALAAARHNTSNNSSARKIKPVLKAASPLSSSSVEPDAAAAAAASKASSKRTRASAFGSLRPPGPKDIRPSRRRRGLDAPEREFTHLIVLDFEWTADNKARMLPHPEIIEWSCVLVEMARPARIVSELQLYVKPEHNPVLTAFSKELTAITQAQVDAGCSLCEAIAEFELWMCENGLVVHPRHDSNSQFKLLDYAIVTWSDADLGSTLPTQMRALSIPRRPHFDAWINLKIAYERVYKKSSRGLQRCVEAIGLRFDGRAHSGLVDSVNTAKIVLDMVNRQNFLFFRTTRFLTPDWEMIGSRRAKAREERSRKTKFNKRR